MNQEDELQLLKNELPEEPIRMEEIHPSMTEVDRQRALDEIVRVLRGDA
ncbi:MAG: hypothetical protein ABIR70_22900 [Bryobacteraceae bacterium]